MAVSPLSVLASTASTLSAAIPVPGVRLWAARQKTCRRSGWVVNWTKKAKMAVMASKVAGRFGAMHSAAGAQAALC
jgi:hypothetical protein